MTNFSSMKLKSILFFFCLFIALNSLIVAAEKNPLTIVREEFRGGWVPTIVNLCFPSRAGLSREEQKREILTLLDTASRARLNHLFFQVRPEADAFYHSSLEPWSRYLTGVQGRSPGFDPLEFFIAQGHRRGIAIHAWFNPYRVAIDRRAPNCSLHLSHHAPSLVHPIGSKMLWLDPGDPKTQDHVLTVITDVMQRYDIDGIHLDDYFYPYPEFLNRKRFPDTATYRAYQQQGGKLSLSDWRRASVNTFIHRLSRTVHQQKPGILFGISPFGIYTKGQPREVQAGLDQFHELYADPLLWMREGWVDYMAPQLYWKNQGPQSFRSLLRWWRSPQVNPRAIPIYPGIALENLVEQHWPVQEIATQLKIEKETLPRKRGGFILWNMKQLEENIQGVASLVKDS